MSRRTVVKRGKLRRARHDRAMQLIDSIMPIVMNRVLRRLIDGVGYHLEAALANQRCGRYGR